MEDVGNMLDQAKAVLQMNDRGSYTAPAHELYPHQWLWDSCFVAIGLRHLDIERAKIEILSLFRGQWANGMLPNMIFAEGKQYTRDRNIWQSWLNPNAPANIATSGITQPPMLAEAIVQIGSKLKVEDRDNWYKMVWPGLLKYHQWLYKDRDPHGEGLVLLIHPWETGLDNTPPWMSELHEHLLPSWVRILEVTKLEKILTLFRSDTKHVPLDQRFNNVEAMALFDVQRRLRRKAYDISRILDHSLFSIEDLAFNSILIRANHHLLNIAKVIGETVPLELHDSFKKAKKSFEELWDPYAQNYFSRDFVTHRLIKESSIASLLPLYSGVITQERAEVLVRQLENQHQFGPAYPVPSVPLNSTYFNDKRYWSGPTWINTNWLIIDGLRRYGFKDHAEALKETSLELIERSGCYEYFDPISGDPLGSPNFSWTAALTIDMLKTK
jgi:hypothetical protein